MSQFGGREEKKGEKIFNPDEECILLGKKKKIKEVFLPEVLNSDPTYKRLNVKRG